MKKRFLYFVGIVFALLFLAFICLKSQSCRKTVRTGFGDTLNLEISNSRNMHYEFLTVIISGDELKNDDHCIFRTPYKKCLPEPSSIVPTEIAQIGNINLYELLQNRLAIGYGFVIIIPEEWLLLEYDDLSKKLYLKCDYFPEDERENFKNVIPQFVLALTSAPS